MRDHSPDNMANPELRGLSINGALPAEDRCVDLQVGVGGPRPQRPIGEGRVACPAVYGPGPGSQRQTTEAFIPDGTGRDESVIAAFGEFPDGHRRVWRQLDPDPGCSVSHLLQQRRHERGNEVRRSQTERTGRCAWSERLGTRNCAFQLLENPG